MLILSDFIDFESSVGYFNNYTLVMSQYIIQKSPSPPPPVLASSNRKLHPMAKKCLQRPGVPGEVGWLPVSLIPALFLFIPFFKINKFEYFLVLLMCYYCIPIIALHILPLAYFLV